MFETDGIGQTPSSLERYKRMCLGNKRRIGDAFKKCNKFGV